MFHLHGLLPIFGLPLLLATFLVILGFAPPACHDTTPPTHPPSSNPLFFTPSSTPTSTHHANHLHLHLHFHLHLHLFLSLSSTTTTTTLLSCASLFYVPNPMSAPARKFPAPCWTHDETVALIDAYREKWYSLRRGNLRAADWDAVSAAVSLRCHLAAPSKTSVQCRHKIEKLRQRYRAEKQRCVAYPGGFCSSWVFFANMDSMEHGSNQSQTSDDPNPNFDFDGNKFHLKSSPNPGFDQEEGCGLKSVGDGSLVPPGPRANNCGKINGNSNPKLDSRVLNGRSGSLRLGFGKESGVRGIKRETDPISEMVSSIRLLGEGFVKMEKMKMDMAREIEKMRMEMEMKRSEMLLESQQQIVDTFMKGFLEKKKKKAKMVPSEF
ncbi:unnamed protein product, partial [Vitis vinifera]